MAEIKPETIVTAIDSAVGSLMHLRSLLVDYDMDERPDAGGCRHLRYDETYTGKVCLDCGMEWSEADAVASGDGVAGPPADGPLARLKSRRKENDS